MTYRQLAAGADRVGRALAATGLPDGARLSTDLQSGPEFFALCLAALKYGFGLFPVNAWHVRDGQAGSLVQKAGVVLHIAADMSATSWFNGPSIGYHELLRDAGDAPAAPQAGYLIFVSSGTTTGEHQVVAQPRPGRPYRGVAVFERYSAGEGFGPHIMGNPTFHLGTLGPALYALQAGSGVVVMRDWSPEAMNSLIRRHSAASAFLSVDLLAEYVLASAHPSGLSTLFHGGAACAPWLKRQAIGVHGPVLHEYYGTSEGLVSEITAVEWLDHPGSVGRPLAGVDVVVSQGGVSVPAGAVGEITIRTRRSGDVGRATVATGDVGCLDSNGYLHILGRATDSGGAVEALVEHKVRTLPGAMDVIALDDSESGVTCLVEVAEGEQARWRRAVATVSADVGARLHEVVVLAPNVLERTATGKISRVAAKRLVARRGVSSAGGAGAEAE